MVTPWISAGEKYTDNILLTDDDTQTDRITTVSPGIRYNLIGKTNELTLSYSPTFSYYDKHPDYDTVRHNAIAEGRLWLARHTEFTVRNVFLKTEEPVTGQEPEDETVHESREPYYTNTATAEISHHFGTSDTISFGYRDTLRNTEDPFEEDSKSHNPYINLIYWFRPHVGIDTRADYTRGDFAEGTDDFDRWRGYVRLIKRLTPHVDIFAQYTHTDMHFKGENQDYEIYDASIGTDYTITERTSLSLSAGYFIQDREPGPGDDQSDEDETGVALNAAMQKTWDHGLVSLTAETGYRESYFGAENLGFDKYRRIYGTAHYRFFKQFSGNISGYFRKDNYLNTIDNREDSSGGGTVGMGYEPLPWMNIEVQYAYRGRDSSIDVNDYRENSIILTITLIPAHPIRF